MTESEARLEVVKELCHYCDVVDFCDYDCSGYKIALNRKLKEKEKMVIKVKLDEGAVKPTKAHKADAAYDLYAKDFDDKFVVAHSSEIFDTGVHIEIPEGYCGLVTSKSGLYFNHDITSVGLVDSGYTGSVRVKLMNNGNDNYYIEGGDKISQMVIIPCLDAELVTVKELGKSDRGSNGFGSSGRK